jgi:TPR repeat protein
MKKKMFLSIVVCIIIIATLMKFYTDYIYNLAIEDYEKKYIYDFNDKHLEKAKKEDNSNAIINKKFIENLDKKFYDSIMKSEKSKNTFIYSIVISNKWKFSEASYNVFMTLAQLDDKNRSTSTPDLDFLDEDTKNLALKFLQKGSDERNPNAKYTLGKYYLEGKYFKKNVILGNSLLNEANKISGVNLN